MERMRKDAYWVVALCAGSMFVGGACVTPYDPYKIPADELRKRVDTVAISPLDVDVELDDVARVRQLIEPRVVEMLRQGGFEVVPPEEWDPRWLAVAHEVGPIFDPVTGRRDDARYQAARSALYHDLALERGVDAIVYLDLHLERVDAEPPSTYLCATPLTIYWPGIALPPLVRSTIAYGACLQLTVIDLESRELYGIRHGIEFEEAYAKQTHARRPLDQRLRDPNVIADALTVIVGPLVTRGR
jgi:hypothetical protein